MEKSTKLISNFIWKFAERCGAQGVTFVVSIVLARLLDTAVYGTVAIVMVFITILQVFVDSGMGNALIQKKDADDLDFSSVFFFNIFMCTVMYLIIFLCAPFIADIYSDPQLILIIRVAGITILISGVKNIQQAYVSRNMLFKKFFFSTLGGTIGAAVVGIIMALYGFGVWAIVVQYLFNQIVDTLILWLVVDWKPKMMFSLERVKTLFSYGWKLLVSALLDTGYNNLYQLIIGFKYSKNDLAFYNQGDKWPKLVITNINSSISSVLFPALSKSQDDIEHLKNMTRRAIQVSSFLLWPVLFGIAAIADNLVVLLLTEKWLPCVPFIRIFCFTYGLWPIHTANLQAINATGHSDIFLKLELVKKFIGILALLVSMRYGTVAMAYSLIVVGIIATFVNALPNKKYIQYGYFEQIRDILPSLIMALIMGSIVYLVGLCNLPISLLLAVQIIVGVVIYLIESIVTKNIAFNYMLRVIFKKKTNDNCVLK